MAKLPVRHYRAENTVELLQPYQRYGSGFARGAFLMRKGDAKRIRMTSRHPKEEKINAKSGT